MSGPFGLPGFGPIQRFEAREAQGFLPRGWIDGLTLSNDTTDATNDVGVAAGVAKSTVRIVDGTPSTLARDQIDLELPINIIKQLDVAFAPENYDPEGFSGGDRSGGRSSSALSNNSWHALLCGAGGLATDVVFHDAATQSSILAELQKIGGYTAYRRIGSIVRASAAIQAFTQYGDEFIWVTPTLDENVASSAGTTAVSVTVNVPIGIIVKAWGAHRIGDNSAYVSALTSTDSAPSGSAAPLGLGESAGGTSTSVAVPFSAWTNTSGQVRRRTEANLESRMSTYGYLDLRGKNA